MVTVGVAHGQIAYVSSSLAKTDRHARPPRPSRRSQGWLKAAANVGRAVAAPTSPASTRTVAGGWTRLTVPGFAQEQQVRLRALALADGSVRPVFEANVVDVAGRLGLRLHLDGRRRHRQGPAPPEPGREQHDAIPFNGEITATDCGPEARRSRSPTTRPSRSTRSRRWRNTADDIVVKIFDPERPGARHRRPRHQPGDRDVHARDSIPAGHLLDAGLPVRRPDRPVRCPRATTPRS